MTQPNILTVPFAENAAPQTIQEIPISRDPSDPIQKASWSTGFPAATMQPLAAGGEPPMGQDFNGILKALSEHIVYQNAGGVYKWSAAVVASGGYPKGAVLQSDDGQSEYVSLVDGNTDNFNTTPGAIGSSWLPYAGHALQSRFPRYMSFNEVVALPSDIGPVVVYDMCGTVWTWISTPNFTGYRSKYCGMWMDGWTPAPLPFQIPATGGTWRESDGKERRVIARYRESGLVVTSANWVKGQNMIADIGGGNWKAPDLRDMFKRMTGTDVDTANSRVLGSYQEDQFKRHNHQTINVQGNEGDNLGGRAFGTGPHTSRSFSISFEVPSAVSALTSSSGNDETRPISVAIEPFIHV